MTVRHYCKGYEKQPCQTVVKYVSLDGKTYIYKYEKANELYKKACENKTFKGGMLMLIKEKNEMVLLLPTKYRETDEHSVELIKHGLDKLKNTYKEKNIKQLSFDSTNKNWENIYVSMRDILLSFDEIEIKIYE